MVAGGSLLHNRHGLFDRLARCFQSAPASLAIRAQDRSALLLATGGAIVVLGVVLIAASPAHADTWAAAQARCSWPRG